MVQTPFILGALVILLPSSLLAASSVTLAWDPSTGASIAGYKVYYGPASRTYTNTISVGTATSATVSNLIDGATYFFAATAYDTASLESAFSNEVTYTNVVSPPVTAPPDIVLTAPSNNTTSTAPATINFAANVTANGHSITKVQFFSGGALLGEDSSAPYAFAWKNVPAGIYSLAARVVYDAGAIVAAPAVSVVVAALKDTPPTISPIADQTTITNFPASGIDCVVGDAESPASNLILFAASANPALVPTNNIVFGGSDSNRTVTLTPASGATGSATITIFVSDGTLTTNTTFQLTVLVPTAALTLLKEGRGTISPALAPEDIIPGCVYTVTAIPDDGETFVGWAGSISSSSPKLTFTLTSNLVLKAKFAHGKGAAATASTGKGGTTYNGLFYEDEAVRLASAGSFTLRVTPNGRYSGRVQLGIKRYPFSGWLDSNVTGATNTISRRDGPALTLAFQIGGDQADHISGRLSDGTWTASLSGDRADLGSAYAGSYTLVVPGYDDSATLPAGDSFGTLKVDPKGRVRFVGTLADGTKVSQSASLSQCGYWPLHVPLYSGNGTMMSWLALASTAKSDLSGTVTWIKQAGSKSKYYLGGFTCQCDVYGSAYQRSTPVLNLPTANLIFCGGNLDSEITNSITIGSGNKVGTPGKHLKLSFSANTGTFKGTFLNPTGGKPQPFSGVVFQKLNTAYGVLFGAGDQTSEVCILEPGNSGTD